MEKVAVELRDRWGIDFQVLDPSKKYVIVCTRENTDSIVRVKPDVSKGLLPFLATPEIFIVDKIENFKLVEVKDGQVVPVVSKRRSPK